jgi:hypothetical protein
MAIHKSVAGRQETVGKRNVFDRLLANQNNVQIKYFMTICTSQLIVNL